MLAKVELVETSILYDVAVATLFHEAVAMVDCPVAPFAGEASVGAEGGVPVVKLHVFDQLLVMKLFFAFTLQ